MNTNQMKIFAKQFDLAPWETKVLVDFAERAEEAIGDATVLRAFIKEHGATPSMVASERRCFRRALERCGAALERIAGMESIHEHDLFSATQAAAVALDDIKTVLRINNGPR